MQSADGPTEPSGQAGTHAVPEASETTKSSYNTNELPETPPEWIGWNKIEETQWMKGHIHLWSCRRDKYWSDWTGEQKGRVFKHERHHWQVGTRQGHTDDVSTIPTQQPSSSSTG
jgi:hypothetical protein